MILKNLKNTQINNGVEPRDVYKVIGGNLGGGTESKLDMQMIATTAPGVQLWYINYNLWLYQMANDMFIKRLILMEAKWLVRSFNH